LDLRVFEVPNLRAHGKRLIIIEPVPEFKVKVMDTIAKSAFSTGGPIFDSMYQLSPGRTTSGERMKS
jgi:hypothetical protein